MATNKERLRAALESSDVERLVALLDDRVVWRGLPDVDYGTPGQQDIAVDDHDHWPDDGGDGSGRPGHDHDDLPLCTSREEVRAILEAFVAAGNAGQPAIVAEAGDSLVVDPCIEPALSFPLHQAFTFRGSRIVLIQDYPDRAAALADLRT
jgi:hypothetical protein